MKLESKVIDTTTIISLKGDLDFKSINEIKENIYEIYAASEGNALMLDFESVETIDSAGIGLLVTIYRKVLGSGKDRFGLINPPKNIKQTLTSSGFTRIARIYPSEEEALKVG